MKKAFPLRLDTEIYDLLKKWSDDELRSVNGQIEFLLRKALKDAGRLSPARHQGPAEPQGPTGDTDAPTEITS